MTSSLFLQAAQNNITSRPPVWFMRQAGRYMSAYQAIRKHHKFIDMIHTPKIACEVTLQPIHTFSFDAAILYCDILVVSEYYGMFFDFVEKKGPILRDGPLNVHEILAKMKNTYKEDCLDCVSETIGLILKDLKPLNKPLIGFAGSPFTVACYLIENGSSKTFSTILGLMKEEPQLLHQVLDYLTTATIHYLKQQIKAGVHAIQLFDTWGCLLNDDTYQEFSFRYLNQIYQALSDSDIPLFLYTKHTERLMPFVSKLPIQVVSVDTESSVTSLKKKHPHFAFQGNLDPILVRDNLDEALKQTQLLLENMSDIPGYIFNLGHGILPQTPEHHVRSLVNCIQSFNK